MHKKYNIVSKRWRKWFNYFSLGVNDRYFELDPAANFYLVFVSANPSSKDIGFVVRVVAVVVLL